MPPVTSAQMAEITDIFNQYAKSGSVGSKKLGTVFRAVGLNPTEAQLADWIKECGSGDVNWDTFKKVAVKKFESANDSTEEIIEAFSVFDKDGSGMIPLAEFKHICSAMGEALSEKEMLEVMKEIDVGSDGMINYKSFASDIYG